MEGIEYRMIATYTPQVDRCIRCEVNQIIFVQRPFVFEFQGTEQQPVGWLYGLNTHTNETGYVPAEFVEFVKIVTPRPRPSVVEVLPVLPENASGNSSPASSRGGSQSYVTVDPRPSTTMTNVVEQLANVQFDRMEQEALQDQPWYWGNVTKEEVNTRLMRETDGAFLVRDSNSTPGEYTLTLRKGRSNKLIKIGCVNGMYGFSPPYRFTSVVDLISHYRSESLAMYNIDLDVTLKYPLKRPNLNQPKLDEVFRELCEADQQFVTASNSYQDIYKTFTEKQQNMQTYKTALNAYEETIRMFEEQCRILGNARETAKGTNDERRLLENNRKMQNRLNDIVDQCTSLRDQLKTQGKENRRLDVELNGWKADMFRFKDLRDSKIDYLRANNVSEDEISRHLKLDDDEGDEDVYHMPEMNFRERYPDHCVQANWYFPHYRRDEAAQALSGMTSGTFLIRDRGNSGPPHACSLVADGAVHHCLIQRTPDGYGFAEPFNLHSSLQDLVLHYAHNSLIPHNEMLNTTLARPLGCVRR